MANLYPIDDLGFPGTYNWRNPFDGGDTAAILGTILALGGEIEHLAHRHLVDALILSGTPVRHPDWSKWYGRYDRFSRDQLIPLACAFVRFPWSSALMPFYKAHRARKFLTAWNTRGNGQIDMPKKLPDITGPEIWALWIRARRQPWGKYVLWLLDIETLVNSILWRWFRKDNVSRNHMLVCLTCIQVMPSFTMRLACWLNVWPDLIARWVKHCEDVGEFQTGKLFFNKALRLKLIQGEK